MKTILVPTDFSSNANAALHYAAKLFASESCVFIIVHSFENQVTNLTSRIDIGKTESVVEELYAETDAKCEEVKQQIIAAENNDKHTFNTVSTSLTLSRAINKLITKEGVDYTIMGSKGKTGARDILLGSNTLAMIRKIKKSALLIVPQNLTYAPLKSIAFATGFKRRFAESELQPLLYLSSLNEASISVVHVQKKEKKTEEQRANFDQLFKILKPANPENIWLPGDTDTYNAITSYLHKEGIDLLAMFLYKHNAIVRLFREATVKDLAKYTAIPFLVLPASD